MLGDFRIWDVGCIFEIWRFEVVMVEARKVFFFGGSTTTTITARDDCLGLTNMNNNWLLVRLDKLMVYM